MSQAEVVVAIPQSKLTTKLLHQALLLSEHDMRRFVSFSIGRYRCDKGRLDVLKTSFVEFNGPRLFPSNLIYSLKNKIVSLYIIVYARLEITMNFIAR